MLVQMRNASSVLFLVVLLLAVAMILPACAEARSYTIDSVNIDATVDANGVVTVDEERTYSFDGSFNGVYWDLSEAPTEFSPVNVDVLACGEVRDANGPFSGKRAEFALVNAETPSNGEYAVRSTYGETSQVQRVKLASAKTDEEATFFVRYRVEGLVGNWLDTGELYWKFVSDGWDVTSYDVTCTIHLPAPAGAQIVPGENVRVWQHHAPLTGEVHLDGADIVCTVPRVSSSDFAEIRAAFPREWVSGLEEISSARLQTILDEEGLWAQEANDKRAHIRIAAWVIVGGLWLIPVFITARALIKRRIYLRKHRAEFSEKYWRDLPSNDHPAVLDYIWDGEQGGKQAMTATLMRLEQKGAIQIRKTAGKRADEYTLQLVPEVAEKLVNSIDLATIRLLFTCIAPAYRLMGNDIPENELPFGAIAEVAREFPEEYALWVNAWTNSVRNEVAKQFLDLDGVPYPKGYATPYAKSRAGAGGNERFEAPTRQALVNSSRKSTQMRPVSIAGSKSGTLTKREWGKVKRSRILERIGETIWSIVSFVCGGYYIIGVLILAVAVASVPLLFIWEFAAAGGLTAPLVAMPFGLVASIILSRRLRKRNYALSAEGVEIRAKMNGLKHWFEDFTNLKEAVPQDVKVWNSLLVMAVVMGVSGKVVERLQVAAPEILRDVALADALIWCGTGDSSGVSSFGRSFDVSQSRSTFANGVSAALEGFADLASSAGGFSSGGGGGGGGGAW